MMIVLLFVCFVFFVTAQGSSLASSAFSAVGQPACNTMPPGPQLLCAACHGLMHPPRPLKRMAKLEQRADQSMTNQINHCNKRWMTPGFQRCELRTERSSPQTEQ
jgi:hypothetical protein